MEAWSSKLIYVNYLRGDPLSFRWRRDSTVGLEIHLNINIIVGCLMIQYTLYSSEEKSIGARIVI